MSCGVLGQWWACAILTSNFWKFCCICMRNITKKTLHIVPVQRNHRVNIQRQWINSSIYRKIFICPGIIFTPFFPPIIHWRILNWAFFLMFLIKFWIKTLPWFWANFRQGKIIWRGKRAKIIWYDMIIL